MTTDAQGAGAAPPRHWIRLWWLPLLAGMLPFVAGLTAFQLSVLQGEFASCNPFVDGCVSISRAGRHGLANIVFRGLLLPAAALQALCWLLTVPWLAGLGAPRDRLLRVLPWIGVTAALFLILYGTFLGTDGQGYRLMRRYGVFVYFGFTCIAMLIVAGAVQQACAANGTGRRIAGASRLLYALVATLPLLGIINSTTPLYLADKAAQDAVGNVAEWWGGLVFTVFFVLLAWLWRRTGFRSALSFAED